MKIIEMTATFGKLNRARLTLEDGLNVIHAPNEAGKSTWCAFLRAMFYGIPTRERDRKGVLAEKNRWQPWSGAPMEGEMRLIWQGKDITLRRFSRGSVPFGGFSAVYTATQEPVPGLTGDTCGQTLLGVGREVWERSAFVGHTPTLAIDAAPELERRIAALVTSGEEEVSFSQTEQLLREWQRRRRHNRTGLIPKLEEELALVRNTLERMWAAQERLVRGEQECQVLQEELDRLSAEEHIHQRLAQRQLNRRYAQALMEQEQIRQQLLVLEGVRADFGVLPSREELLELRTRLAHLVLQEKNRQDTPEEAVAAPKGFAGMDGVQAVAHAHDQRLRGEQLHKRAQTHLRRRLAGLLPGAGVAAVLAALALWRPEHAGGLLSAGAAAVLLSALLLWRDRRAAQRAREELVALLGRYGVSRPDQIVSVAQEYHQQEQRMNYRREEQEQSRQRLEQERDRLLAQVTAFAPRVSGLSHGVAAVEQALNVQEEMERCAARLEAACRHSQALLEQGVQELDTLEQLSEPQRTPDQTRAELARVRELVAMAQSQTATARGELLSLGDRAQMEARAQELEHQLRRRQQEYEALELALDCLRQANARLQERFAPELNHRAGQLLQQLTGGRYRELALNRAMEASARNEEELLPRSTLALSRGTTDQVYLAVRLAVCQLCLGQEDPSPLVLDDALLTFDEERLALALDCLARFGRQVVLFSCQERELRLGKGNIQTLQS